MTYFTEKNGRVVTWTNNKETAQTNQKIQSMYGEPAKTFETGRNAHGRSTYTDVTSNIANVSRSVLTKIA